MGQTDIKTTGHKVKEFPFQEHAEQETAVEQKTVKINVTLIIWIVLGLLAVAAGGFCVYRFREKLSALRFRFLSRKRERDKRVVIVKNRRRKRRKW